jgi:hypothetical protein
MTDSSPWYVLWTDVTFEAYCTLHEAFDPSCASCVRERRFEEEFWDSELSWKLEEKLNSEVSKS